MERELATTSREFEFRLQRSCGSPLSELSDFGQSAQTRNELQCHKHVKVAEHSFLVPMCYLSLFSNHWLLGSQNWQGASSTKEDCILICFIGLGTVTMATQLVVNQH